MQIEFCIGGLFRVRIYYAMLEYTTHLWYNWFARGRPARIKRKKLKTKEETELWIELWVNTARPSFISSQWLFYAPASWHLWGKFSKVLNLQYEGLRFQPRALPLLVLVLCSKVMLYCKISNEVSEPGCKLWRFEYRSHSLGNQKFPWKFKVSCPGIWHSTLVLERQWWETAIFF